MALVATRVVPLEDIAGTSAPLTLVVERSAGWIPPVVFTLIAVFAVADTALINLVMGSRLA